MYTPPTANKSYDPNHPPHLSISPSLAPDETALDEYAQQQNIARYGIAGRVWDATFPIIPYLTLETQPHQLTFDPPCSIFTQPNPTILELGSGQSHASLHLLSQLTKSLDALDGEGGSSREERKREGGRVVLSDLGNVVPLVRGNVDRWLCKTAHRHQTTDDAERGKRVPDVEVVALPWGDIPAVDSLLSMTAQGPITHILMIDLIYFPHLYGPLIRTLLHLTNPPSRDRSASINCDAGKWETEIGMEEVHDGPEIILCYKSRSLEFEEAFFTAFERWFRMAPLLSQTSASSNANTPKPALSSFKIAEPTTDKDPSTTTVQWGIHGNEQGVYTYICHRRADTLPSSGEGGSKGWWTPETDEEAMRGPVRHEPSASSTSTPAPSNGRAEIQRSCGTPGCGVDRSWGWAEAQLGAIEWD